MAKRRRKRTRGKPAVENWDEEPFRPEALRADEVPVAYREDFNTLIRIHVPRA